MGIGSSGMGPAMGTWDGIQSWAELAGVELEPWEARTMIRLCVERANIQAEKLKSNSTNP